MEQKVNDLGLIFFVSDVSEQPIQRVRQAFTKAGFDPKYLKEIKPRNVFIRAIRKLAKAGMIEQGSDGTLRDKIQDDEECVRFQFSARFVNNAGVTYDPKAVVRFEKVTANITCENQQIQTLAIDLYNRVGQVFIAQDVNALAKRVVDQAGAKKIPLRDAVWFLGRQFFTLAESLKVFYDALDCSFFIFPVNTQANSSGEITKAVVNDVVRTVKSLQDEIKKLKEDGSLTPRIAKARLKELGTQLKQYKSLADSIQVDLNTIIHDAGRAGEVMQTVGSTDIETICAGVLSGKKITPLVFDLLEVAEPEQIAGIRHLRPPPIDIGDFGETQEQVSA